MEILFPSEVVDNVPEAYNVLIQKADSPNVVFFRDGCYPLGTDWVTVLLEQLKKSSVVGAFGTKFISTHAPILTAMDPKYIYGSFMVDVAPRPLMFKYEKPPTRVVCVDGAMLAFNGMSMAFDETLKYFYDIDFSLRVHQLGKNVSVADIPIGVDEVFVGINPKVNTSLVLFRRKWEGIKPYILLEE